MILKELGMSVRHIKNLGGFVIFFFSLLCGVMSQFNMVLTNIEKIISAEFLGSMRGKDPTKKQLGAISAPGPDTARDPLRAARLEFEKPSNLMGLNSSVILR